MQSTSPTSGRSTVKFSRTVWRAPLRTVIPWCLAVTSNKSSSNDPQIQELLKRNPCLVLDYQCCVDKRLSLNFHPFVQFTALSEQFDNFPNIKTPWRLIGKSASAACLMLVTVGSGKMCFQCFHDQSKIPFIVTTKFVHRCLAWICHLLDNGNFSSQRTMISWFSTWCTNSVLKAKLDCGQVETELKGPMTLSCQWPNLCLKHLSSVLKIAQLHCSGTLQWHGWKSPLSCLVG